MFSSGDSSIAKTIAIMGGIVGIVVASITIFTFVTGVTSLDFLTDSDNDRTSSVERDISATDEPAASATAQSTEPDSQKPAASAVPTSDPNPPLRLPFSDDFDDGMDPAWRIVNGTPLILDGRLTAASDDFRVEIGNSELRNYTLEMDVWGKDADYCGFSYWKYLEVGLSPQTKFQFGYTDFSGSLIWYVFDSGTWTKGTRYNDLDCGRFRVVVADSSYSVFIKGELVTELTTPAATSQLSITLDDTVTIDNLTIR